MRERGWRSTSGVINMTYKPSQVFYGTFSTIRVDTFALTDADALPTAYVKKNGTTDGAVTVTVTNLETGRYQATFTVPSGYVAGDDVEVIATATVNSVVGKISIGKFLIDTKYVSDAYQIIDDVQALVIAK